MAHPVKAQFINKSRSRGVSLAGDPEGDLDGDDKRQQQ